jgi:tetratricopeptide (TPR) repeat protein
LTNDPPSLCPALVPILLAGALVLPPPLGAQEAGPDAVLSRAVVLHQSGDLEGAAALYVQVLRAFPGAARVRSNLGAAYAGLGRYDEAAEQYRGALEREDDPSIRRNLALALQKAGWTREALAEASRILDAFPGNRDALLLLADCHLRLGESQAAADRLAPAARAAPDDKAVAYLYGTALLELGRTSEAEVVMDRVFRDGSPEGHVLMGLLYSRRQDWSSAQKELEKARGASPAVPLASFLYGQALLKSAEQSRVVRPVDWEAALAAFRAELAIDPNHFESNLYLGNLLREEGRAGEALVHLERAARLRPGDLAARFSLGAACVAAGRLEEGRALLEPVAQAAPAHLPTQMQLAALYARLGDKEKAEAARAAAVRLQKEADARSFEGASEVIKDLIGRTSAPGGPGR